MMTMIRSKVGAYGHSNTIDDSGATVGKRYARNDELGIPFAVTLTSKARKTSPLPCESGILWSRSDYQQHKWRVLYTIFSWGIPCGRM